jgi:hypothetical protein
MHFALALGNKVGEEDIYEIHSADPLSIQRYNMREASFGYTPCHFLCMQRYPNILLVRYLSLRDLKAFSICRNEFSCIHGITNNLELAAKYSENVELLKILLQIDQLMSRKYGFHQSSLGCLCERSASRFSTFDSMFECLIAANSSVDVVIDGLLSCFKAYGSSDTIDIKELLAITESLLELNGTEGYNSSTFRSACMHLKGESCISVLKLLFTKYNEGAGLRVTDEKGRLPIHIAARESTLDVVEFLLKAYPESINELTNRGETLLHLIPEGYSDDMAVKFQFICDQCPSLLHIKALLMNPLEVLIINQRLDLNLITIMCEADSTILSDECREEDDDDVDDDVENLDGMLPLHLMLVNNDVSSSVSLESDIIRYFLRLYPAAVGIRDSRDRNAYDLVRHLHRELFYFIRILLNADRTIEPEIRLKLNYQARRDALFLSFRALSTDRKPMIWVKLRHESRDLLRHTMSYL